MEEDGGIQYLHDNSGGLGGGLLSVQLQLLRFFGDQWCGTTLFHSDSKHLSFLHWKIPVSEPTTV